jgi:hypothetical protein
MNPIPERADQMRAQAKIEGGLCIIEIPEFLDSTHDFLDYVVLSIVGADCSIDACRSEDCNVCTENGEDVNCTLCSSSSDCDGLEDVVEYRYCECDAVVTVNENNEFVLYTGEEFEVLTRHYFTWSNPTTRLSIFSVIQAGKCNK